ncbi:MAG: glycosyltransferase family 4 protein [bacterium]|nr:glycosyltransferase family 4 protein [bacterium]
MKNIDLLGWQTSEQLSKEMQQAAFLIFPSEWYEGFPMVLAKAFAHGLPVIASRLGAVAEIVEDGKTGLLFEAGNADDLAAKVRWMQAHPAERERMGHNARQEYLDKYTPEKNYQLLMEIYERVLEEFQERMRRKLKLQFTCRRRLSMRVSNTYCDDLFLRVFGLSETGALDGEAPRTIFLNHDRAGRCLIFVPVKNSKPRCLCSVTAWSGYSV